MNESRDNIIFVGGKPFMNYVTSVLLQFTKYEFKEVILKSRGKFISKAVDVAEVSKKKFLKQIKIEVKDVKIDSEDFETKEGKKINVSTIEIILEKKD
ncbi:MAG: DNA-binding protein Alba [Candidatus Pacearchaeota archaeon]